MKTQDLLVTLRELAGQGIWALSGRALGRLVGERSGSLSVSLVRASRAGHLVRLAGGFYRNSLCALPSNHLELLANWLRPDDWFYLSLESVLHEAGYLLQMPNRLAFMTSGRSYTYHTPLGVIEFTHTRRSFDDWQGQVSVDWRRGVRIASPELAWADLKRVGRNLDLVSGIGAA